MKDLIQKLEEAEEGSRELDVEIAILLFGPVRDGFWDCWRGTEYQGKSQQVQISESGYGCRPIVGPKGHETVLTYTTSIDAALTLVPEGWSVRSMGEGVKGYWFAILTPGDSARDVRGDRRAPALALCIATLKAREAS